MRLSFILSLLLIYKASISQEPFPIDTILFSEDANSCIITSFESATINDDYYPIYEVYDNLDSTKNIRFVIILDSVRYLSYDRKDYSYSYFKSIDLNKFIKENHFTNKGIDITKDIMITIDSIFIENNFPLIDNERCILCGKANLFKLIIKYNHHNQIVLSDTIYYTNQSSKNLLKGLKDGFKNVYTEEDGYIGMEGNGNFIFYNEMLNAYFFRINYTLLKFSYSNKGSNRIFYTDTTFYSDGSFNYYADVYSKTIKQIDGGIRKLIKAR